MADMKESLGIPNFGPWYVVTSTDQDSLKELIGMSKFVETVLYDEGLDEFNSEDIHIQFINYGNTQLVFVVTVDNSKRYTLLVNQPATKYGIGKNEFDNLNKLNQQDPELVIKPMHYFKDGKHELYMTPYYYQARCVGVNTTEWGVWIPEPSYYFKVFGVDDRKVINSTMIAMLIRLYDGENGQGITKCRLDGGDFMLLKGYESEDISFDNITKYFKLIAARELTTISLDDYIDRLRIELSSQDLKEDELIILGKKLRCPFTEEEIETGIEMGLSLRNKNVQYKMQKQIKENT